MLYAISGLEFLPDDTECGRLLRSANWSASRLGHPGAWSPTLRAVSRLVLANRLPMTLWWGPEFIQIYNDAFRPLLGAKHSSAMGMPVRQCWPEWKLEGLERAANGGGIIEEADFSLALSPVPDETAPQGIGGLIAIANAITDRVIGERHAMDLWATRESH